MSVSYTHLAGANGLTDGSAAVAKRFRISDLVIAVSYTHLVVTKLLKVHMPH